MTMRGRHLIPIRINPFPQCEQGCAMTKQIDNTEAEQELAAVVEVWGPHLVHAQVKAGRVIGMQRFMFTWAILADITPWSYEQRWCYHSYERAEAALAAWSGEDGTEPTGWHKDAVTGRRRDEHGNDLGQW
jgi:hypothetical protein